MVGYNPYQLIGEQHFYGLLNIESNLSAYMLPQNLYDLVYNYVQPIFYSSPDQFIANELNAVMPNAVNDYILCHRNRGSYTMQQNYFIRTLCREIYQVPVESIEDFLSDMNDKITASGRSTQEQIPLLIAVTVGQKNYEYWMNEITDSGSNWYTCGYFNTDEYANRANIPYWVGAAMEGTLFGANKARQYGMIDPPRIVGVDMVSALAASLTVTTGKVMFRWGPCLSPSLAFSEELREDGGLELREDDGIELRE